MNRLTAITAALALALALSPGVAEAQTATYKLRAAGDTATAAVKDRNVFNHMDLGLTLGTTGVGIELAMPIGSQVKVRTGVAYMPKFSVPFHFDLMSYTADGTAVSESSFESAKEILDNLAGFEVNQRVKVNGKPNMFTFKFLVDVYPFRSNKHWHLTAGFYIGPKKVATAVNDIAEAPTLVSVGIYNGLYDYFTTTDFIETPLYGTYYLDPDNADALKARFEGYGRMGIHVGDFSRDVYDSDGNLIHSKGDPYIMEPGSDGTVRAKALVNVFRPYLGLGYTTTLDRAKRLSFSVEGGAMFWGGSPKVVTHEGIDLVNDLENISGSLGDYVDLISKLKVYPVLNFRISYAIF